MLAGVVEFALTQRLLVVVLTLLLVGAGVNAFRQLPIDAFPDVSSTQVKIIMKAPGMTPEEVESRVVTPIELEMLGIPHKRILRSASKYAIADITIDFDDGTDIYWARQQVTERLDNVHQATCRRPSAADSPRSPRRSARCSCSPSRAAISRWPSAATLLDWMIRPALRTLPGVADVNSLGGIVRSFEVVPDNAALQARGIHVSDLHQALEANNRNDGAGRLRDGEETLLVRVEGSVRTMDDIAPSSSRSGRASPCASATWPRCASAASPATVPSRATARAKRWRAWCSACAARTPSRSWKACGPSSPSWRPRCPRA